MTSPTAGAPRVTGTPAGSPSSAASDQAPSGIGHVARRELWALVELLALTGFALAQPVYDVFGRSPDQFVFRGADRDDIIAFAFIVLVGPALALWAVEAAVGLVSGTARRFVRLAIVGLLVAAFAMQALRSLASGSVLVAMAALAATGAIALYARTEAAKLWLRFAAVAPPAFCALFLLSSQTSQLLSDPGALGNVVIGDPAPVVVIVFDELPLTSMVTSEGEIDAELYPNFAEVAGTSTWFRNTTAVSNFTWTAVPSMLTGRLPRDGTTPIATSHPENLFTLLGESMGLEVTETVTRLCPEQLCETATPPEGGLTGLLGDARSVMASRLSASGATGDPIAILVEANEDAAHGDDDGDEDTSGVEADADASASEAPTATPAQQTPASVRSFIDGLDSSSRTLHYLHVLLPHVPYRFLPDGTGYPSPDPDLGRQGDAWVDEPWLVDQARQRHLLQLQYTDAIVGRVLDRMKESDLYDDALLVLVADHGMSFEAGGAIRGLDNDRELTDRAIAELMWVPFIVKEPGQDTGRIDDRNVSTVDVLPTIADVLDVEVPWDTDGRSAFGRERTETTKQMYRNAASGDQILAGPVVELDQATGFDLVLGLGVDRFVSGTGADRLWRLGPAPDLIGRRVDDLGRSLREVDVSLAPFSDASDVAERRREVPALVAATVEAGDGLRPGAPVAISVDGVVRATAVAYADDGTEVSAMVPRDAFSPGPNDVRIHAIVD